MKISDFNYSDIEYKDIVSIFIPGVVSSLILFYELKESLKVFFENMPIEGAVVKWIVFIISSYVLGTILKVLSSPLDRISESFSGSYISSPRHKGYLEHIEKIKKAYIRYDPFEIPSIHWAYGFICSRSRSTERAIDRNIAIRTLLNVISLTLFLYSLVFIIRNEWLIFLLLLAISALTLYISARLRRQLITIIHLNLVKLLAGESQMDIPQRDDQAKVNPG